MLNKHTEVETIRLIIITIVNNVNLIDLTFNKTA